MGRLGMWVCTISLVLASSLLASPSYAAGSARGSHVVAVARPSTGAIGSDFGRCNAAWNPAGDGSGTDTFTPTTHMGWAYQISKLSCNNNGSYDYFSIYFHGTATSSSGEVYAYVQSVRKSGSPTQYWVDWSPGTDTTTGNCTPGNFTFSVSYIVGLSYSNSECEHWDIAKGAAAGSFETIWYKDFFNYVKGNRNVGFLITTKVAQGKLPVWTLTDYVSET